MLDAEETSIQANEHWIAEPEHVESPEAQPVGQGFLPLQREEIALIDRAETSKSDGFQMCQ